MKTHWIQDGIMIRPYQANDGARLYEAVRESIPEMSRWLPWCHAGYTRRDSETWIASRPASWEAGEAYSFVILNDEDTFLGGCGINQCNANHNFANLGYWVRTSATGHGVATAATRLVAQFGFQELGLTRIEILAGMDNEASQRVAEKAGARFEGILRNRLVLHGVPYHAAMYSLIPLDLGLKTP